MNNYGNNFVYVQQAQQLQRHEIARMQQLIQDMQCHMSLLQQRLITLGQTMKTREESQEYADKLWELNVTNQNFIKHYEVLNQMIQMANLDFSKTIPEQCKREIYHLYHAGRYTQEQLAYQYQVSQSAVSKIVNGPAPLALDGINPNALA